MKNKTKKTPRNDENMKVHVFCKAVTHYLRGTVKFHRIHRQIKQILVIDIQQANCSLKSFFKKLKAAGGKQEEFQPHTVYLSERTKIE